MSFPDRIKRHRYPSFIVSHAVWMYHRYNLSYRGIQEEMAFRGIIVSHEAVRSWCLKFSRHFREVIRKRERKPTDKWHLDEMMIKINGEWFILWRAVDILRVMSWMCWSKNAGTRRLPFDFLRNFWGLIWLRASL